MKTQADWPSSGHEQLGASEGCGSSRAGGRLGVVLVGFDATDAMRLRGLIAEQGLCVLASAVASRNAVAAIERHRPAAVVVREDAVGLVGLVGAARASAGSRFLMLARRVSRSRAQAFNACGIAVLEQGVDRRLLSGQIAALAHGLRGGGRDPAQLPASGRDKLLEGLTETEVLIVECLCEHASHGEIAAALGIARGAVGKTASVVARKLGVNGSAELQILLGAANRRGAVACERVAFVQRSAPQAPSRWALPPLRQLFLARR